MRKFYLFTLLLFCFVLLTAFNTSVFAFTIKDFFSKTDVAPDEKEIIFVKLKNFPDNCTYDIYGWDNENEEAKDKLHSAHMRNKHLFTIPIFWLHLNRAVIYCESTNEVIHVPDDAEIYSLQNGPNKCKYILHVDYPYEFSKVTAGSSKSNENKSVVFNAPEYEDTLSKETKVSANVNESNLILDDVPDDEVCKLFKGGTFKENYSDNRWKIDFNEYGTYSIICNRRMSTGTLISVADVNNDNSGFLKTNYNDLNLIKIPIASKYSDKENILFPDGTEFLLKYGIKPGGGQLLEQKFSINNSLIKESKILNIFQKYYKNCGAEFVMHVTSHPNFPASAFKQYLFGSSGFLPANITFEQKNYAKIKVPHSIPFTTTLPKKSSDILKRDFCFIVSFHELSQHSITFAGYQTLKLASCNNSDKVLEPESIKLPKFITLVQKNNQTEQEVSFPKDTKFTLSYYKDFDQKDFNLHRFTASNSQIILPEDLKIFQKHYNLFGEHFELKVTDHPDIPEKIFEIYKKFSSSDKVPEKVLFSRKNYAKIKIPTGFKPKTDTLDYYSELKKQFLYVWTKSVRSDLSNITLDYEGYDPLTLETYSDDKSNILELKKIKPLFVSIPVDNNVAQIKFFNEKNSKWIPLSKSKTNIDSHMFLLPQDVLKQKTLKIKTSDSSAIEKVLRISDEKPVKDNKIIYALDFGKCIKLQLKPVYKGISAKLKNNGEKLCEAISNEKGEVLIRHEYLRVMHLSQLEIEIMDDIKNEIFFHKNKFIGDNMIQVNDDVCIIDLKKAKYFHLIFQELATGWITIDRGNGKKEYDVEDKKVQIEWEDLDNEVEVSSIRQSLFPEFDFSSSFEPFIIDKRKLKRVEGYDYPVYKYSFPRRSYEEPQKIEITCNGEGWEDSDYGMIKIATPYGEVFKMKSNNPNKQTVSFELCIPSKDKSGFYHTSKVQIEFEKDKYKRIYKSVTIDVGESSNSIELKLTPLHKDIYKISLISLVGDNEKRLPGSYLREGTNQWNSFESGPFTEEIYGPLKVCVRSNGYIPQKMKFDEPGDHHKIDMGSPKLPLWIIINAEDKLNDSIVGLVKVIPKGIKRMIDGGRLLKDQIWISIFIDYELEKPLKFAWTSEEKLKNELRKLLWPDGVQQCESILQKLNFVEEKTLSIFTKKGFNLYIISPFQTNYITSEQKKQRFQNSIKPFTEWLNKDEVTDNLSELLLIDLDPGREGNERTRSSFGYIEKFYKDKMPFLRYEREVNVSALENVF
ncbi:MAG: hypothetical protein GY928_12280 [Colwellia sp.]|nr:hypothetical protein [Colwellia sp.]